MILEKIVADTRVLVAERKASQPEEVLRERLEGAPPTLDFLEKVGVRRLLSIYEF